MQISVGQWEAAPLVTLASVCRERGESVASPHRERASSDKGGIPRYQTPPRYQSRRDNVISAGLTFNLSQRALCPRPPVCFSTQH